MKRRPLCLVFASLLMAVVGTIQTGWANEAPWEQVSNKNGIKVERRKPSDSPLHEFRATGEVDATPARLLALFAQVQQARHWMAGVKSMTILEKRGDFDDVDVRCIFSFSLGIVKRQAVLEMKTTIVDDKRVEIKFQSKADHASLTTDPMPLTFLRGQWIFTPIGPNKTRVVYQAHSDPGGTVGSFPSLINFVSKDLPHETLENLKEQLTKGLRGDKSLESRLQGRQDYKQMMVMFSSPGSG